MIKKCISFGDTHCQLMDQAAMRKMTDAHGRKADYVFLVGDSLNMSELSPFPGPYPDMSMVDEINLWGHQMATLLANIKPSAHVYLASGNHGTGRQSRRVQQAYGADLTNTDLLLLLSNGYALKQGEMPSGGTGWLRYKAHDFSGRVHYAPGPMSWMMRVGVNLIMMHHTGTTKLTDTTARKLLHEYVVPNYPGVEIVIEAHTHRRCDISKGRYRYIEQGCMCHPGQYSMQPGNTYAPTEKGYVTFDYDTSSRLVVPDSVTLHSLGHELLAQPASRV